MSLFNLLITLLVAQQACLHARQCFTFYAKGVNKGSISICDIVSNSPLLVIVKITPLVA